MTRTRPGADGVTSDASVCASDSGSSDGRRSRNSRQARSRTGAAARRAVAETEFQLLDAHVADHADEPDVGAARVAEAVAEEGVGADIVDPHAEADSGAGLADDFLDDAARNQVFFESAGVEFGEEVGGMETAQGLVGGAPACATLKRKRPTTLLTRARRRLLVSGRMPDMTALSNSLTARPSAVKVLSLHCSP